MLLTTVAVDVARDFEHDNENALSPTISTLWIAMTQARGSNNTAT